MAMTTSNADALIRAELYSRQLEENLNEQLLGIRYARNLKEFPDGDKFILPSMGTATVRDYVEDAPVVYDPMDVGRFEFEITEYVSSGTYITKKMMQDSFWAAEIIARFVPEQLRAIMEKYETDCLALANSQTLADENLINGFAHRFCASGTNEIMSPKDFSRAKVSLKKAKVKCAQPVAIVDPVVAHQIEAAANIVSLTHNPKFEGLVRDGIDADMKFKFNVYGVDVYESNLLPKIASETIDSITVTDGVANIIFDAADEMWLPFLTAWRQMPKVDAEFNKDKQREEYVTTARYGKKLYRPENLVVILSSLEMP